MKSFQALSSALVLALVLALSGGAARAQPTAAQETITLERAVELAMQQQPQVRQQRAAVEAALGRVDQARVALRPTVNLSASASVGSSRSSCDAAGDNCSGGFFDPTAGTGLSARADWLIYDFGQTRANIRAAELSAQAAAAGTGTTGLDVRTNVEVAYLEAVARQRLVKVAEATVQSEELHLDQARRFVAAQAKDPIEVAQAQARAANARSSLAQAQSLLAIALANLRAAIGWLDATRSPIPDTTWPIPPEQAPPELGTLVQTSRQNRPELFALDKQIEAAEANLQAAHYGRRPTLSATASTQWTPDTSDATPAPTWSAGVVLSWQLFDGGRAKAEQRIARANVASAQAQRDTLLVSLTSQLELARAQIGANRVNVQASAEAVTAARAQLQLAEARYTQGLGSQIELADAQTAITTAEGNLVQAQWQLAEAWAQLRRAIGDTSGGAGAGGTGTGAGAAPAGTGTAPTGTAPAGTGTAPAGTGTAPAGTGTAPAGTGTGTAPAGTGTAPAGTGTAPAGTGTGTAPAPTGTRTAPAGTAPAPAGTAPAPTGTRTAPAGTAPAGTAPRPAAGTGTAPR